MQSVNFVLSPHKVSLAVLIQDLCTPEKVHPDLRQPLTVLLLGEVRQAKDYREKTLSQLCKALSDIDSSVGDKLSEKLARALSELESPDDLFDALISLEGLLLDGSVVDDDAPCLDSSSVFGLFVRKILIKFHTGLFEGLTDLFERLKLYVEQYTCPQDDDNFEAGSAQTELSDFFPYHAALLETDPPSLQLDDQLELALQNAGEPPGASYLRYAYAVQQLDMEAAEEHLHRLYDFGLSGCAVRGEARDRPLFHWALLNLTALYFRFGHMAPALQALEEAVRLAQNASDHNCLAAALLWLVRLVGAAGERQLEGQLLRRCVQRAAQLKLPGLQVLALQSLAVHRMQAAQRPEGVVLVGGPQQAPERAEAARTAPLHVAAALAAARGLMQEARLEGPQATMEELEAAVWDSVGRPGLAAAHARLACLPGAGVSAGSGGLVEDACRAACLSASVAAAAGGGDGEAGRRALAALLAAREAFPPALRGLWLQVLAEAMCAGLPAAPSPTAHIASQRALATTALHAGDGEKARDILLLLQTSGVAQRGQPAEELGVMLDLAAVHARLGNPSTALPLAMRVYSLCEQHGLDGLAGRAGLAAAGQLVASGLPSRALALLRDVLPLVLSTSPPEDRAEAHLVYARAILDGAESPPPPAPVPLPADSGSTVECEEKRALSEAVRHLEKAGRGFKSIDYFDKMAEVSHLQALVWNALGDQAQRNSAAEAFWKAEEFREASQRRPISPLCSLAWAPLEELKLLADEA